MMRQAIKSPAEIDWGSEWLRLLAIVLTLAVYALLAVFFIGILLRW